MTNENNNNPSVVCVFAGTVLHPLVVTVLDRSKLDVTMVFNTLCDFRTPTKGNKLISLELVRLLNATLKGGEGDKSAPSALTRILLGDECTVDLNDSEIALLNFLSETYEDSEEFDSAVTEVLAGQSNAQPMIPLGNDLLDLKVSKGTKYGPLRYYQLTGSLPYDEEDEKTAGKGKRKAKKPKADKDEAEGENGEKSAEEQDGAEEEQDQEDALTPLHVDLSSMKKCRLYPDAAASFKEGEAIVLVASDFVSLAILFKSEEFRKAIRSKPQTLACISPVGKKMPPSRFEKEILMGMGVEPTINGLADLASGVIDRVVVDKEDIDCSEYFISKGMSVLAEDLTSEKNIRSMSFLELVLQAADLELVDVAKTTVKESEEDEEEETTTEDVEDGEPKEVATKAEKKSKKASAGATKAKRKGKKAPADTEEAEDTEEEEEEEEEEKETSSEESAAVGIEAIANGDETSEASTAAEKPKAEEITSEEKKEPEADTAETAVQGEEEGEDEDAPQSVQISHVTAREDIDKLVNSILTLTGTAVDDTIAELVASIEADDSLAHYAADVLYEHVRRAPTHAALHKYGRTLCGTSSASPIVFRQVLGKKLLESQESSSFEARVHAASSAGSLAEFNIELITNVVESLIDAQLARDTLDHMKERIRFMVLKIAMEKDRLLKHTVGAYLKFFADAKAPKKELRHTLMSYEAGVVGLTLIEDFSLEKARDIVRDMRANIDLGSWGALIDELLTNWEKGNVNRIVALGGALSQLAVKKSQRLILAEKITKLGSIAVEALAKSLDMDAKDLESMVSDMILNDELAARLEIIEGRVHIIQKQ